MRTAAALVIGNEVLSGKVADANTPVLARALRAWGVDLRRVLVVPDELDAIVEGVRLLAPRHDALFTSGGVGPTHDDVTLEGIARGLGRPLRRHAEMEAVIREWHDAARNPLALRMADLPEGAALVWGEGMRVPVVLVENVYILPGVPSIFERKVLSLRDRFREEPFHLRVVYVGEGEVEIAGALFALAARHPALLLGSYPEMGNPDHRVKLTLESKDRVLVERALEELVRALPEGCVRRVE